MYESFQILIDDPAATLALGFDDYAAALAEVATVSRPQFAIGIFGAWGSGKSTLMKAIKADVGTADNVVPIWFNAWRYEKEEHLIVPLRDTMREQLLDWAEKTGRTDKAATKARNLAVTLGRAAKAVLAGISLKAGIPDALDVSLEANKVLSSWHDSQQAANAAAEPKSFYHAAFLALQSSVKDFIGDTPPAGEKQRRIVVFVDDIDRCLPKKALEVLESMKLFFDLDGFVFIVGLDQRVIEQAVHLKYPATGLDTLGEKATYITGVDYVKKIFQVQFTAPRVDQSQLESFVAAVAEAEDLPEEQRQDLRWTVVPQIGNLAGTSSVNPREVKRLINAYTLQMKVLERKLLDFARAPDARAVLALQIMSFRQDWEEAYTALSNNPTDFVDAVGTLAPGQTAIAVDDEVLELPLPLLSFLQNDGKPLLEVGNDLEMYVSALEASRSTDPAAREISRTLGRVRVAHKSATPETAKDVRLILDELSGRLSTFSVPTARATFSRVMQLVQDYPPGQVTGPGTDEDTARWLEAVGRELPLISQEVNELRRRTTTSATSAV